MAACKGLAPHLKTLGSARGVLGCLAASRGLFGASRERPGVSQSKVLSGDDGPLFFMVGECVSCICWVWRHYEPFSSVNRIKPEFLDDYIELR